MWWGSRNQVEAGHVCETGYECIFSSVVVVGVLREGTDSCTPPPKKKLNITGVQLSANYGSPVVLLKYYDPPVATATLLFYF